MHALVVLSMILCGPINGVNAFRRTTRGYSAQPTPHGHVAPVSVGFFSLFAAIVYHLTWAMSGHPDLATLVGGIVAALCVSATIVLLFYDPSAPRRKPARRKKA
jgi:hypothetical protein